MMKSLAQFINGRLRIVASLLVMAVAGCSTLGGHHGGEVGEIHLFGIAKPFRGANGPEGVAVEIYASEAGVARGIPIRHGRVEVMLYDRGDVKIDPHTEKPLRIWTFEGPALDEARSDTLIGDGYHLVLKWDQDRPKNHAVTVFARYHNGRQPDIYSAPATINVSAR